MNEMVKEFFLNAGNRKLAQLTANTPPTNMRALNGSTAYAQYSNFRVGTEAENFRLNVSGYSGTAGK